MPEFPGQTHSFFHRDLTALRQRSLAPEVISTRQPPPSLLVHSWSNEMIANTEYLFPPQPQHLFDALHALMKAGPRRWWRCLCEIRSGQGARAKRLPLVYFGAVLAGIARRRGWSHIHSQSCAKSADLALFCRLLGGPTYSLTLHGPLHDYGLNQPQKWRNASFAIIITERLRRDVEAELHSSLPPKVAIAPMGVDIQRFHREKTYRPWDGCEAFRIFTCGRLNPCKGHDDLIRAISALRNRGIRAHLRIAGHNDSNQSNCRDELLTLVKDLNVRDQVELLGALSEEAVRAELETAHAFALASLEEPLGVAIMEAMAMELPVVVTGAGGVPELVVDGHSGRLVRTRDPDHLADSLAEVARRPDLALRLGAAARTTIEQRFHSGINADRMLELLNANILGEEKSISSK